MNRSKLCLLPLIIGFTTANAGVYFNAGLGAVFSSTNTGFLENSSAVLYSPTSAPSGSSLFTLPNVNWQNHFKNGFNLNAAVGYRFTNHVRSDFEFIYQNMQRNSYGTYGWLERDSVSGNVYAAQNNNPISNVGTRANVYSLLTNAAYDFDSFSNWTPFIGGGLGVSWLNANRVTTNDQLNVDDPNTPLVETAPATQVSPSLYGTAFAWEFKAGLSHELSKNSVVLVQYRVFGTTDFRASESTITSNPGTPVSSTFYIPAHDIAGLLTQAVEVNVRWEM